MKLYINSNFSVWALSSRMASSKCVTGIPWAWEEEWRKEGWPKWVVGGKKCTRTRVPMYI